MEKRPRILVFTGEGKGKTTAALGMILRAAGHGMPALLVQFVKCNAATGELAALKQLPQVQVMQVGLGFVPASSDAAFAKHRAAAQDGWRVADELIASGRFELLVLDEVCYAVYRGLLEEAQVLALVAKLPAGGCLVLTGRGATPGLLAAADTVTEMCCVKHGFNAGIKAQQGVEV